MSDAAALSIPTRKIHDGAEILMSRTAPVESLHLRSKDGDTMPPSLSATLASAPCLRGIRRLHIEEIDLGGEALDAITCGGPFAELEQLVLENCDWHSRLGPKLARALAHARLPRLSSLVLSGTSLGSKGVGWLGQARTLPGLRDLALSSCEVGDDGLRALLRAPLLAQLTHLHLVDNGITDAGVVLLATAARPASLAALSVVEYGGLSTASNEVLERWNRG
jgi:hypothetical protein